MERLAPLIISMTIAAIASSPDAENLARSEASVEPVNFFARDKTILELSRSRQRGEEGGEAKRADRWIPCCKGIGTPVYQESELETRPPFNCLFFPSPFFSPPRTQSLTPSSFSGEEVAHERRFFSFFFLSLDPGRSWNERGWWVITITTVLRSMDSLLFGGYRWTRNF